eukprot:Selendium_serpulae@DN6260_c1_g2_i2.p1
MRIESLVTEINRVRMRPQIAANYLATRLQHYKGTLYNPPARDGHNKVAVNTKEGPSAMKEAIEALRTMTPLTPLMAANGKGLSLSAKDKVTQLCEARSTTGPKNFGDRLKRYGIHLGAAQEVTLFFGQEMQNARDVVERLIVDDGNGARSYRKALLNRDMKVVGSHLSDHPTAGACLVMIFAAGFADDDSK